jgi:hypothetical protein
MRNFLDPFRFAFVALIAPTVAAQNAPIDIGSQREPFVEKAQRAGAITSIVTVCSDGGAGGYEAFPDVCRLADRRLQCIFYASYTHVGIPNERWPRGGKIGVCWSKDEGRTWSEPETLFDSPADDRDPSITQLKDGRLICSFFTSAGAQVIEARAPAGPWSAPRLLGEGLGVSSPVRELSDGTLIVGTYFEKDANAYGSTIRSLDRGQSWEAPVTIDNAGQYLDAETDVIELKNGELYAALRGGQGSTVDWSRSRGSRAILGQAQPLGFVGHCPYLHRAATGEIVLAYRQPERKGPPTARRCGSAGTKRGWSQAILVDSVIGAYPSMVNLKDGSVLIVYYEEGAASNIRARKFCLEGEQVNWLNF